MPLLSIIEQNSTAIQRAIGDSSLILEHHSNMVREAGCSEDLSLRELLMENWDAPITVTTLVQFLETLFSGKTSAIRRFRSLCSSVIVIDEVQTVPTNMLTLFNLAVNFLVKVCGATVVLCSATQPSLEKADHPLFCTPQPIVPHDDALWQTFSRTRIIDAGAMQLSELPAFIQQQLLQTNSLLVICNKKATATKLYAMVKELADRQMLSPLRLHVYGASPGHHGEHEKRSEGPGRKDHLHLYPGDGGGGGCLLWLRDPSDSRNGQRSAGRRALQPKQRSGM